MGGCNVLINNAGILRDGLISKIDKKTGEVKTLSKDQWDAVISTNLTGPFLCSREFASAAMENKEPAVIVNMSSLARHGDQNTQKARPYPRTWVRVD